MNSYYYGKSGKGDYTPDDLPKNRWQLFMEMLRTRMSGLCRMNLMYFVAWLPAMIAIALCVVSLRARCRWTRRALCWIRLTRQPCAKPCRPATT